MNWPNGAWYQPRGRACHPGRRIDADGYLTVPDTPGLGAKINHPAVARYARTAWP